MEAPKLHLAQLTLNPISTYSYPFTLPLASEISTFPSAVPSHEVEHVFLHVSLQEDEQSLAQLSQVELVAPPLHDDEQSLAQLSQVGLVELPLHDDEQSEHGVLVALP